MHSPSPAPPARRPGPVLRRSAVRAALVALCLLLTLAVPGPARGETGRWQWPLPAPHQVVRGFEAPAHDYGPGHRGIDIAVPGGAGAAVSAVESGTVRFAGDVAGRGVVSVLHSGGLISTYEPVAPDVEEGQAVATGDRIGAIEDASSENAHCPDRVCLHLGARQGEDYLDPLLLLGERGPSVLLPWSGSSPSSPAGGAVAGPHPVSAAGPGRDERRSFAEEPAPAIAATTDLPSATTAPTGPPHPTGLLPGPRVALLW